LSYIGNTPAENYASFLTETFSVSATANYTLSHAVTNENEIRLVINGVVQQPGSGKAYTASGTTLTLTSATVSGDVMYAVYLGRALQTVNPPNASVGTAQLADSSVTSAKLGTKNTPAFFATLSSTQTVSNETSTKAQCNTEILDTDSAYDNATNYRFTPQVAGKYFVFGQIGMNANTNNSVQLAVTTIKKNGSTILYNQFDFRTNYAGHQNMVMCHGIIDMNGSSDYLELFGEIYVVAGSTYQFGGSGSNNSTSFGAYKIIE